MLGTGDDAGRTHQDSGERSKQDKHGFQSEAETQWTWKALSLLSSGSSTTSITSNFGSPVPNPKLLKVPLMSFAHFTTCRHEFHALGEAASSPCRCWPPSHLRRLGRPLPSSLFLPSLATRWLRLVEERRKYSRSQSTGLH